MASKIIYFGHITSYGESGFNSSGAVPAVELAVEHVNNNASILAGYKLVSTPVMDSECDRIKSLDAFFSSVVYATSRYNVIALLGCGCGVATEPVAEISHRWNITQVSYASGSSSLSNRAQFKNYFRTWPSFKDIAPGLVSILKHYNWTRVSFLTQKENLFTSFQYSNAKMSCYLKANLQATNFTGVTGAVQFDSNGTRVNHKLSILQYRIDGSNLVKKCIGYINLDQNATYPFYDDCNETSLSAFPKGIPPDGTPLNVTSTSNFAMSITYFVLASTGIILVLVCGAFNIGCRNTKVVRLTSPNLNYFILIGALLLYSGMYSNIVLTTAGSVRTVQCHPIHDWHLIILVLTLSGVQMFLLFLGSVVPVLQPNLHLIQNAENPVLIETRKVKVSALNDSKYVAAIIYISSITLLTLLFTHFGFYNYVNISHGVLNGVIFINTTAYLGLIFCPKMISLYKDPNGSKVFRKSFSGVQDLSDKEGEIAMSTAKNIMKSLQMKEPPDTDGAS
eukprot:Em0005g1041a